MSTSRVHVQISLPEIQIQATGTSAEVEAVIRDTALQLQRLVRTAAEAMVNKAQPAPDTDADETE